MVMMRLAVFQLHFDAIVNDYFPDLFPGIKRPKPLSEFDSGFVNPDSLKDVIEATENAPDCHQRNAANPKVHRWMWWCFDENVDGTGNRKQQQKRASNQPKNSLQPTRTKLGDQSSFLEIRFRSGNEDRRLIRVGYLLSSYNFMTFRCSSICSSE